MEPDRAIGPELVEPGNHLGIARASALSRVLTTPGVPVVWFDGPYLQGDAVQLVGEQASPERMDVYNRLVHQLISETPAIHGFPWKDYVDSLSPAEQTRLFPDGIHVVACQLGVFLDKDLWPELRSAYLGAIGHSTPPPGRRVKAARVEPSVRSRSLYCGAACTGITRRVELPSKVSNEF